MTSLGNNLVNSIYLGYIREVYEDEVKDLVSSGRARNTWIVDKYITKSFIDYNWWNSDENNWIFLKAGK